MRKLLPLLIVVAGMAACGKEEPPPLTKEQIKRQMDSVTAERIKDAEQRARRDLEFRLKIETGAKTGPLVPTGAQNAQPPSPSDSMLHP